MMMELNCGSAILQDKKQLQKLGLNSYGQFS